MGLAKGGGECGMYAIQNLGGMVACVGGHIKSTPAGIGPVCIQPHPFGAGGTRGGGSHPIYGSVSSAVLAVEEQVLPPDQPTDFPVTHEALKLVQYLSP